MVAFGVDLLNEIVARLQQQANLTLLTFTAQRALGSSTETQYRNGRGGQAIDQLLALAETSNAAGF